MSIKSPVPNKSPVSIKSPVSNKPFEKLVMMSANEVTGLNFSQKSLGPPLTSKDRKNLQNQKKQKVNYKNNNNENIADENENNESFGALVPAFPTSKATGRGATTRPSAKWTNCQVPYTISNSFSSQERSIILEAFEEFARETGIAWVPRFASHSHYVHLDKKKGCNSQIGKVVKPGGQLLSLGKTLLSVLWFRYLDIDILLSYFICHYVGFFVNNV